MNCEKTVSTFGDTVRLKGVWIRGYQELASKLLDLNRRSVNEVSIGNSMICSDIWHKYHEWYFKIVIRNLRQFWNITSGIYAKYQLQIMLLFVYITTRKRFVIFSCRYFKLRWNTAALSQSNCRNFSCSSINLVICFHFVYLSRCQCHELPYADRPLPL